jgi:hypothetical protein
MKFTTLLLICYILTVLVPSSMCLSLAKLGQRRFIERMKNGPVVKDTVPPSQIKIIDKHGPKTKNKITVSDEVSEELGDQIPEEMDGEETTYNEGDEAQQNIYGNKKKSTPHKVPKKGTVVTDTVPPPQIKIIDKPGPKTKNKITVSDEVSEELGDQIPEEMDGEETTYNEGDEEPQNINGGKKNSTPHKVPKKGSIVTDTVPPKHFKPVPRPGPKTKNKITISDEVSEELGDQIPEEMDGEETTYNEGDEAQQQINEGKNIASSKYPVRNSVVKGIVLPQFTKTVDVPGTNTKKILVFSDESRPDAADYGRQRNHAL